MHASILQHDKYDYVQFLHVLPVAQVTAQGKQVIVKTLNRLFLQYIVDSTALVDVAHQNVILHL